MMDLFATTVAGTFGLAALLFSCHFAMRAWSGWLELKKMELASGRPQADAPVSANGGDRIEIADLKARIRKLEAIASGIDL